MKIILAQPRGFCAGVERAIESVESALEQFGAPVYVLHEIVHNRHVVRSLEGKGARARAFPATGWPTAASCAGSGSTESRRLASAPVDAGGNRPAAGHRGIRAVPVARRTDRSPVREAPARSGASRPAGPRPAQPGPRGQRY
ncbi:hypothetical protein JEY13_30280, partial [Pseudomonas aeruginosa]|nr:hypothetical protein [Pseudomonas aeruginosa]